MPRWRTNQTRDAGVAPSAMRTPDLATTLAHDIRHEAEDAKRREQSAGAGEGPDHGGPAPRVTERGIQALGHDDVDRGKLGIESADGRAEGPEGRGWGCPVLRTTRESDLGWSCAIGA